MMLERKIRKIKMKGQVQKFSLIELLVVMVVMGMLLTMAIPSFNRMISGNKVDQLASQLKLAMEQAQSRAITERRHVALILPNRNNRLSGENNTQSEFGGCRMAFVTHKGEKEIDEDTGVRTYSEGWYFLSWVPDSAWKPAISGAILVKTAATGDSSYDSMVTTTGAGLAAEETIANIEYDGLADINEYDGSSSTKNQCAIIFSPYGGIAGSANSLRFAIAEAVPNGSAFVFPTRDTTGPTNFRTLELNRFTGRVKHFAN